MEQIASAFNYATGAAKAEYIASMRGGTTTEAVNGPEQSNSPI